MILMILLKDSLHI